MTHSPATANEPQRAGVVKRCVVYLVAALTIACLATIAFAGATEYDDGGKSVFGAVWYVEYVYGWPWRYCEREPLMSDAWFVKRSALGRKADMWNSSALIGDAVVFGLASTAVVLLARRALRGGWRFTLARAMMLISLACAALGYVAWHRQLRLQEDQFASEDSVVRSHLIRGYCGPRWLLQFVGNGYWLENFRHCTYITVSPESHDWLLEHIDEFEYLRRIEFISQSDDEVRAFLRLRERWEIDQIEFNRDGTGGLTEVHRCPRLKTILGWAPAIKDTAEGDAIAVCITANCPLLEELRLDGIGDAGLHELSRCRRLHSLAIAGPISDDGVASLTNCRQLSDLVLQQTQLTERSVETFRQLPRLKRLWLDAKPGNREKLSELVEALELEDAVVFETK